jgi:hypothetical protein
MSKDSGVVKYGAVRHVRGTQQFLPLPRRAAAQKRFEKGNELRAVLNAQRVGGEARIIEQILLARRAAEALPLAIVADGEHDVTVGRLEELVGNNLQMGVPLPGGDLAARQISLGDIDLRSHRTVEQC